MCTECPVGEASNQALPGTCCRSVVGVYDEVRLGRKGQREETWCGGTGGPGEPDVIGPTAPSCAERDPPARRPQNSAPDRAPRPRGARRCATPVPCLFASCPDPLPPPPPGPTPFRPGPCGPSVPTRPRPRPWPRPAPRARRCRRGRGEARGQAARARRAGRRSPLAEHQPGRGREQAVRMFLEPQVGMRCGEGQMRDGGSAGRWRSGHAGRALPWMQQDHGFWRH